MGGGATMQSVVLALQLFWAERGCLVWQPYNTQVGAGTMNPATFLRALGPEPWRVVYVEPSVRPDDARYGENPNRLQQHYQLQVILKPDPGNPQELYLQSLEAIGIDPSKHDLRFVEDKWEAPALGAWGLGWEVWLDGQEITQFTYFQQAGGLALDPVSVEITYGLERILIGLLSLDHFKDIPWTDSFSYGDVQLQAEQEYGAYYLEQADVERLKTTFALSAAEARQALDTGLMLPAYDHLLKCSHSFNVLDARGAVGVTERAGLFAQMRDLARAVAQAYIAQREALSFPWMDRLPVKVKAPAAETPGKPPSRPADFVLEVGTEELPAGDLRQALAELADRAPRMLEENRLVFQAVRVGGTPRRLVLEVEALAPSQEHSVEIVKGPPEARAFDSAGHPTQAALGWARKYGLSADVDSLRTLVRDLDGGRYLAAEVTTGGRSASEVLANAVLPALLAGMTFDQSMRWIGIAGDQPKDVELRRTSFARPIRWLVALHGEAIVPFSFAGLTAGRASRGLRFQTPEDVECKDPSEYRKRLAEQGIVLDPAERRAVILKQAQALATETGGEIPDDPALLEEIANLVEAPQALLGSFDPSFLALPREVLVAVMKKHQRYFPVERPDGDLMPSFVAVSNGRRKSLEAVRAGNEHVLRARFADAAFFLGRDRGHQLETFRPKLASLTFQADLGSMLAKSERVERLTVRLADELGLGAGETAVASRAAFLCKADLATSMVVEMTALQGIMGRIYALESGEPEAVAQAIYEHHQPRFAGDALPGSSAGTVVALADRLDSLAGLFAAGLQPTGARDPFGLRRAAIGLIQLVRASKYRVDLRSWLATAAEGLPIRASDEALEATHQFIVAREEALLLAQGSRFDVVAAVLAEQGNDPTGAGEAVEELQAATGESDWATVLQAYARCARILPKAMREGPPAEVRPDLFELEAEGLLLEALAGAAALSQAQGSVTDLVRRLRFLVPAITRFFDDVLVMAEAPKVRANRLTLVHRVVLLAEGVADLARLEGF